MKTLVVGGGPAGLYYGILARKLDPSHEVEVFERNALGDTFGWGVVFSDQTLGALQEADPESFAEIEQSFAYWNDIDVFIGDACVRSTGHGFCGLARKRLLEILERRAVALGVKVHHDVEIDDVEALRASCDLLLASDGVNSRIRERYAASFGPSVDWRKCKFAWLGMDTPFPAFTFLFRENEHGVFSVHAYPFDAERSTFIVECREETYRAAGLDRLDEDGIIAYMEALFAEDLAQAGGPNGPARLLRNRTFWRTFPTVRNASWRHENVLLVGDAAHTAHFSIGSGTKLAMEDAIALVAALRDHPGAPIATVLDAYEAARRPEVERIQTSAQTSLEWFEHLGRYIRQDPLTFAFSLLTRSKRITYGELNTRDPALVARVRTQWGAPPAFAPLRIREVELPNRIVVSPMCQYSAVDGRVDDWHLVHLGSRAVGGAGLVIAEATGVSPDGRISLGCAGLWNEAHAAAWKRVVDFVHARSSAKIGIQLAHAGRKGATGLPWEDGGAPLPPEQAWELLAPSPVAYDARSQVPRAMDRADMDRVRDAFVRSTELAEAAGFDVVEVHLAHGYLLNTFLSALSNHRTDEYGGDVHGRLRFPLEVVRAVRAAWPAHKPLFARISATEWAPGGLTDEERIVLANALTEAGVDLIDCSAGGVVPYQKPVYGRMFQVPFSDQIRHEAGAADGQRKPAGVRTMAVGNVQNVDQAHTIVGSGRADLVAIARGHLADPYLALHAAAEEGHDVAWPPQYLAAKPSRRKG